VAHLPEVILTFLASGAEDFPVYVAVTDPARIRSFVLTSVTSDDSMA
jgi:hypothetical protein